MSEPPPGWGVPPPPPGGWPPQPPTWYTKPESSGVSPLWAVVGFLGTYAVAFLVLVVQPPAVLPLAALALIGGILCISMGDRRIKGLGVGMVISLCLAPVVLVAACFAVLAQSGSG